jgi:hypothetical protein
LDKNEIKLIQGNRNKDKYFYKTLKGVLIQLLFLTLLYNVANITQDPNSYKYQNSLKNFFSNGLKSEAVQFDDVKFKFFFKQRIYIIL